MNHPGAFLLAKLAAAVLWTMCPGCTASYRAMTATGLDRPYRELAGRARGEPPPPIHAGSVPLPPTSRFHPVPVRPVFLPEGTATEVIEPGPHEVVPPGDFPPPVDREIPARRDPAENGAGDLLAQQNQSKTVERSATAEAEDGLGSRGWRAARHAEKTR